MQTYWMALTSHTFVIFKKFLRNPNCLPALILALNQDLQFSGKCVSLEKGKVIQGHFLLPRRGMYA